MRAWRTEAARNDNLGIHEDRVRGVYVKGLREVYVTSYAETMAVMRLGAQNRIVRATSTRVLQHANSRAIHLPTADER